MIFRYPGGKQKVAKQIVEILRPQISDNFHDVCVGGGSVLCEVAVAFPFIDLYANDLDPSIFSFWSLFEKENQGEWDDFFIRLSQKPTIGLFNELRSSSPQNRVERAYYGVFFNRTTFSGIQKGSPIGGQSQKSEWTVDCRYNYEKFRARIEYFRPILCNRLKASNQNMVEYLGQTNGCSYVDPPYYHQGKKLYAYYPNATGHAQLSRILRTRAGWVLSYDACDEIRGLYSWAHIESLHVNYTMHGKKTGHRHREELVITPT